jgi:DNA-binding MarR family transcriptional regulator
MNRAEAAERFVRLFHEIYHRYYRRREPADVGPTRESLAVLEHLARTGPLAITEAAAHFSRSQSAMSELVDRMVSRGLLERLPDERDRRRHLIWLTQAGLDAWRGYSSVLAPELLEVAFARFDTADRDRLLELMARLAEEPPVPQTKEDDDVRDPPV